MPLRIHRDKMFISGEAWRLFQKAHPKQDFSDFWLEVSLRFSMGCFDLSSFFLLRKKEISSADELDFAYASDIADDNSCKPGYIVELSL
jgi:hypothetical protein